jgi:hypothetical protein
MNLLKFKQNIIRFYQNSQGWRTNRKIVVIESDDWGCIRMPSKEVFNNLQKRGYELDKFAYLKYDSLETAEDFEAVFSCLKKFKDSKGNHPIITANTILTNPDFNRIEQSGFNEYITESFIDTLNRESGPEAINLFNQGISEKMMFPQLHGREHLNVKRWMRALQDENGVTREVFNQGLFDLSVSQTNITENSFVDALTPANIDELDYVGESIKEASIQFKEVFGFQSKSFIAPCYIWRPETEKAMFDASIKYIQSGAYQLIPEIGQINKFRKKMHFTGQKNKFGQIYTVRNALFEPSLIDTPVIENTLTQIERAFSYKKPAIISMHRINFSGRVVESNRTNNLKLFNELLSTMLKKWPDIEFMHSSELGDLISR